MHKSARQVLVSKKTKRQPKGYVASSDASKAQGRGPNVPRFTLGADTLLGIAQATRRTLAFSGNSLITSTTGAYSENPFVLNGPFNVLSGASAIGYGKYMQFYTKCFVLGARIIVKACVVSPSGANIGAVGVVVTTATTSLGSVNAAITNGMCQWDLVGTNPDHREFTESVDISRFLFKPKVLDDPQLFCTIAANPPQVVVAHVFFQGVNGGTQNLNQQTEIFFDCVFTDPIPFT